MTKIYLIRHADTLKENLGVYIADDTNQEMNEKCVLSAKWCDDFFGRVSPETSMQKSGSNVF